MRTLVAALGAALVAAGCASNPAEDPVQIKLNDIDARLGSVERVVSNQSLVEMSRRLDTLETQLREQRGNVEVLQKAEEGARKSQRDLYADLDRRISALEAGLRGAPGGAAPAAAAAQPDGAGGAGAAASAAAVGGALAAGGAGGAGADDQGAYAAAFELLKGGSYADAVRAFKTFMDKFPASTLLDNAQYWIGEAYYVTRDYDRAAQAFRAVGERWPASRKAPDALLKLGFTQFEQKHLADARATLKLVLERFPGTESARLAQEKLRKLPAEGR
jgi:tol-pal system protein YbgF